MSTRISLGEVTKRRLDEAIHVIRARVATRPGVLTAYERMLTVVHARTDLLSRRAAREALTYHTGIASMAFHHADWLMPVETWCPPRGSRREQFASLAMHLFARFAMPRFMTTAWTHSEPGVASTEQRVYKELGRGQSIRRANLPLRITRAMAHRLTSAPCHLTMIQALRWVQIHELDGSDALVHAILETRLGSNLENETFWEGVIHFFVNHPELALSRVADIVEFLQHQKFEWRRGVGEDGVFGHHPPPQPELSIRGRSARSLLRLVDEWHEQRGRRDVRLVSWEPSPFRPLLWVETRWQPCVEDRVWSITELCSNRALAIEGRILRHCASTYVAKCASRRSSLWSLQVETRSGQRRIATVEVDLSKRSVVQARGKCNRAPSATDKTIIRRWAQREGIEVDPDLRDLQ